VVEIGRAEYDWTVPDASCGTRVRRLTSSVPRERRAGVAGRGPGRLEPRLLDALPPRDPQHCVSFVKALVTRMPAGDLPRLEQATIRDSSGGGAAQYGDSVPRSRPCASAPDLPIAGRTWRRGPTTAASGGWAGCWKRTSRPLLRRHHASPVRCRPRRQRPSRLRVSMPSITSCVARARRQAAVAGETRTSRSSPASSRRSAPDAAGYGGALDLVAATFWYDSTAPAGAVGGPGSAEAGQRCRRSKLAPCPRRRSPASHRRAVDRRVCSPSPSWRAQRRQIVADVAGFANNVRQLRRTSTADVCQAFLDSPEFKLRWAGAAFIRVARHVLATVAYATVRASGAPPISSQLRGDPIAGLIESADPLARAQAHRRPCRLGTAAERDHATSPVRSWHSLVCG
jgi:hypothetical protein